MKISMIQGSNNNLVENSNSQDIKRVNTIIHKETTA